MTKNRFLTTLGTAVIAVLSTQTVRAEHPATPGGQSCIYGVRAELRPESDGTTMAQVVFASNRCGQTIRLSVCNADPAKSYSCTTLTAAGNTESRQTLSYQTDSTPFSVDCVYFDDRSDSCN